MKQNKYLTKQNKQKRSKTLIAWMKALENVQIWWKQKRMDTNINQTKQKKFSSALSLRTKIHNGQYIQLIGVRLQICHFHKQKPTNIFVNNVELDLLQM